jgi:uncharacterized protein (TIGR00297 family)
VSPPLILAAALAAAIAAAAWRSRSLNATGAVAAFALGLVALRAGWSWGAYLVTWFAVTSMLSRAGRARKARHVGTTVAKGGERDARQVLANGGLFGCLLLLRDWLPGTAPSAALLAIGAVAALAAAGADTWATEVGTWARATAWSLRTRRRVPAGTSGAITWPGSVGLLLGAGAWTGAALALGVVPAHAMAAVLAGGVLGAVADTLVGAWWQVRRRCARCAVETEQSPHACGTPTAVTGGLRWLDNDAVNLLATATGAAAAVLIGR